MSPNSSHPSQYPSLNALPLLLWVVRACHMLDVFLGSAVVFVMHIHELSFALHSSSSVRTLEGVNITGAASVDE
jgi:hypothetical protein